MGLKTFFTGLCAGLPYTRRTNYPAHTGKKVLDPAAKPPRTTGSLGGFHGGPIPDCPEGVDPMKPSALDVQAFLEAHSFDEQGNCLKAASTPPQPPPDGTPWHRYDVIRDVEHRPEVNAESIVGAFVDAGLPEGGNPGDVLVFREGERRWEPFVSREIPQKQDDQSRSAFKDQIFMHMALTLAELGTCCRLKVGCLLLTETGSIAGGGFNGAGAGMKHCHPDTCNEHCRCRRTRHAEKNGLSHTSGTPYTAYLTHEPCADCAKDLIAQGVRRIVYSQPYTSIAPEERDARQEWIDHYKVVYEQLPSTP